MRFALAVLVALVLCPSALAARTDFWGGPFDQLGQAISGVPDLQVLLEDNWDEWNSIQDQVEVPADERLLGFAAPDAPRGSLLYHRIFLAPEITRSLVGTLPLNSAGTGMSSIASRVDSGVLSYRDAAVAILVVIHEAYHYRLMSGDESRVNACALRDMSLYLPKFDINPTRTKTTYTQSTKKTTVKVPHFATVVQRKRVNGKLVTIHKTVVRYETVTKTVAVAVPKTETEANPAFNGILDQAQAFRDSQPAPYNTGVCS